MDTIRSLMHFNFLTNLESSTHYHLNPEIFYILRGNMDVKIDDKSYHMSSGDMVLINANKSHTATGSGELLGARFEIDYHVLTEYMGSMQLLFWCNTVADKNNAYGTLRNLLDRILTRYFEKDEKSALYLNALYYETVYVLTSNFMVKTEDVRINSENSQDRMRLREIQNYIQSNYQSQVSLNDLAEKLYLSNTYLSRYIKKHLGMTFVEYLNNIRLFHAVDELMYSEKTLTRIAFDNGYPTSAAFTKAFRDMFHQSPSEYRSMLEGNSKADGADTVLKEEEEKKILEYLKFREEKENPHTETEKNIFADAEVVKGKFTDYCKAVNLGDIYLLMQYEVQEQIKLIQSGLGIKYIRVWNILSKEHCLSDRQEINFRRLDKALDFLLENKLKPYIELGNKPSLISYTPERAVKTDTEKNAELDFETFSDVIGKLFAHLINRYGVEEIETWHFEYWNNPSLGIEKSDGEYFKRFDMLYRTIKRYSENIPVGGAGFILGYEIEPCKKIFSAWKEREIHPDFLSFCSFQYIAIVEEGNRYGRKSIDSEYMINQMQLMKDVIKETGFDVGELHIDEWNFTISNRNILNDSCEQGAYILKNCIEMNGNVDFMAYWHALDIYSDHYDTDMILIGDTGLISREGISKPSFYAFNFLNRLKSNVLEKNENSIVTSSGHSHYVIACHNYKNLSSRYVFTEEDEIEPEDINQYFDDVNPIKLNFTIGNVKNGKYLVKIYYLNTKNGSIQDMWRNLAYSRGLARDEVQYLVCRANPTIEMKTIEVENGEIHLENNLEMQEIRLIDIRYRYDSI